MTKHYGSHNDAKMIAQTLAVDEDLPTELSERQRRIVKYRMRGLTQNAIAQIENISQPMVSKEVRAIRKVFAETGKQVEQDVVVGASLNLYEEIGVKGWELYHKALENQAIGDANKALATVMAAQEKSVRLLMDLGLVKRAAVEHKHTVAPFLEQWEARTADEKQLTVATVIDSQLSELEAPEPPQLMSGDDEEDADE